jgi:hypothetical protein
MKQTLPQYVCHLGDAANIPLTLEISKTILKIISIFFYKWILASASENAFKDIVPRELSFFSYCLTLKLSLQIYDYFHMLVLLGLKWMKWIESEGILMLFSIICMPLLDFKQYLYTVFSIASFCTCSPDCSKVGLR